MSRLRAGRAGSRRAEEQVSKETTSEESTFIIAMQDRRNGSAHLLELHGEAELRAWVESQGLDVEEIFAPETDEEAAEFGGKTEDGDFRGSTGVVGPSDGITPDSRSLHRLRSGDR